MLVEVCVRVFLRVWVRACVYACMRVRLGNKMLEKCHQKFMNKVNPKRFLLLLDFGLKLVCSKTN